MLQNIVVKSKFFRTKFPNSIIWHEYMPIKSLNKPLNTVDGQYSWWYMVLTWFDTVWIAGTSYCAITADKNLTYVWIGTLCDSPYLPENDIYANHDTAHNFLMLSVLTWKNLCPKTVPHMKLVNYLVEKEDKKDNLLCNPLSNCVQSDIASYWYINKHSVASNHSSIDLETRFSTSITLSFYWPQMVTWKTATRFLIYFLLKAFLLFVTV